MNLTPLQLDICKEIVSVFETGKKLGDYSAVGILNDGPHGYQISYGKYQINENAGLHDLLILYNQSCGKNHELEPFINKINLSDKPGYSMLSLNNDFIELLKQHGTTSCMQQCQDMFFDNRYFAPALRRHKQLGLTYALSLAVVFDSYVHSGCIPTSIRAMFLERPPSHGGDEKAWITAYVSARQDWLCTHSKPIVQKTVYRTLNFKQLINDENWDFNLSPIRLLTIVVYDENKKPIGLTGKSITI